MLSGVWVLQIERATGDRELIASAEYDDESEQDDNRPLASQVLTLKLTAYYNVIYN